MYIFNFISVGLYVISKAEQEITYLIKNGNDYNNLVNSWRKLQNMAQRVRFYIPGKIHPFDKKTGMFIWLAKLC